MFVKEVQFNKIKSIVKSHGGKCISTEYVNAVNDMNFVCKVGHQFTMKSPKILNGCWCKKCHVDSIKLTIDSINEQYMPLNIKCISTEYKGNKSKLEWKCMICEHIFGQSKNGMDKDFTRCRNCKNIEAIQKAHQAAQLKGGICLTSVYTHSQSKMTCRCFNEHIFSIRYANLVHIGSWCAKCSENNYVSEMICRAYFEGLFGSSFPKTRPAWLINNKNNGMELDGYSSNFNLAFEHNGTFHYKNTVKDHAGTASNDAEKLRICQNLGIKLIIIPMLFKKVFLKDLRQFILNKCQELKIDVPYPNADIDLTNCYNNTTFEFYKLLAISRGGQCLSSVFLGVSNEKLLWQCKEGHQWLQFPYVLKKGCWCPVCANKARALKRKKRNE